MGFDPNAPAAADPNAFPGSAGNVTLADDTLFGVGKRLGSIPVKLSGGTPATRAQQADYAAGGQAGSGASTQYGEPPTLVPYESALKLFSQMSPDERASIQAKLLAGGFFPKSYYSRTNPSTYTPGIADADSRAAFEEAVRRAAQSNSVIGDVIDQAATARTAAQAAAPAAKPIIQLTNPTDLRKVAIDTARKVLGHNPDSGFVDNFVAAYHAAETTQGQQAASASQQGGTVTQAPSAAAMAEEQLRTRDPAGAFAHDVSDQYGALSSMISKPGGGQ